MKKLEWWVGLVAIHMLVIGLVVLLSGCGLTQQGDFARAALKNKGKEAAAKSLENSEWFMCRGSSVGAVKDRYGISADKAAAYNIICFDNPNPKFNPIIHVPKIFREEEVIS